MYKADLHLHTNSSDGLFSPSELIDWAVKKQLDAVAITDHDTTSGIKEAVEASQDKEIEVIPGIELSCTYKDEEIHILGYFIDIDSKALIEKLSTLKDSRERRGEQIVEKLQQYGLDIDKDEVKAKVGKGSFGRPHIARVLVEKGIVSSTEEAFNRFLIKGKPGYVERYKITVEEAIELIHKAGGVAVMAHPGIVKNKSFVMEILKYGFDGIEVIHSQHDKDTVKKYEKLSDKLGIIKTAGSDCHGVIEDRGPIIGKFTIGKDTVDKLKEKRDQIRLEVSRNGKQATEK